MASSTAATQYATGGAYGSAVFGSEAYDLDRVVGGSPLPQEDYAEPSYEEREQQRVRERERARENERARAREQAKPQVYGIPLLGIVGALVAAALVVTLLLGYVQLAAVSSDITKVRNNISELEETNESLKIKYEVTFNMADVEAYAINILGMTRAEASDTVLGVKLQDKAEILAPDETAGIFTRISSFLKSLPEYFR